MSFYGSSNRFNILKDCDGDVNFKLDKYKKTNYPKSNTFKVKQTTNNTLKNLKPILNTELFINNNNFPELNKQSKQQCEQQSEQQSKQMNYLAVAKREQKPEVVIDTTKVEPGWVRLWKKEGIIYSKYGLPTKWRLDEYKRDQEDFKRVSTEILKQWQNEREEITELLGDRSPYYDTPSLLEYLPEDEDNNEEFYNDNNSDSSDNI